MADLTQAEYKKLMQEYEKNAYGILSEQTEKIMKSERLFTNCLDMLADHVSTSVSNTILVQAQMPNATAVNSIKEWEKRNVPVRKDLNGYYPTGIYQFANAGHEVDDNGELHTKFKVVKAYDAEQTVDPDYARSVMNKARPISVFVGADSPEQARNLALCNSSPIRCLLYDPKKLINDAENISENEGLRYIPETKTVIIRQVSREEWFQRVAYEIALGIFHKREGSAFNRANRSFEAGVVSYLLCRYAGVNTDTFRFDLTNLPSRYPRQSDFRAALEMCQEISHDLAFRLNKKIKDQNAKSRATARDSVHFAKE